MTKMNKSTLNGQTLNAQTRGAQAPVVLDVAGTSLTDDDRRRLQHPLSGGLILFGRNWQSREQLTALTADIKAVRPDVLICVDHEGGRVQRFRQDGFTHLPPMRVLGERWVLDPMDAQDLAAAAGYVLAAELRACGVDLSFTPVLDLDWGCSAVIGDRAFHADARVVTDLARSLMWGLLQAGMQHCGKHFPGHGHVEADSHVAIPVDTRSLTEILASDALPYKWLRSSLSSVMPAHVVYEQVDSLPAGFSKRWLKDILRAQLGFAGAVFSDDLSMEAARLLNGKVVSYTEAAVVALNAGCDLILLCNQSVGDGRAVDELLDGLSAALTQDAWQLEAARETRRLQLLPSCACTWIELQRDVRYQTALKRLQSLGDDVLKDVGCDPTRPPTPV
jgi:beta-N-acetylhexosaminidase